MRILLSLSREDGWKAFRIQGVLDFSLIGILSKISTVLAENQIGIVLKEIPVFASRLVPAHLTRHFIRDWQNTLIKHGNVS